jgi:hypothetical protein
MSQPESGEHSVRSLAEILREHGLETELGTRPGRRRRTTDEPGSTGRSPRVEPGAQAPRPQAPTSAPAAGRSSAPVRSPGPTPAAGRSSAAPAPVQARVPVTTWPDPAATGSRPAAGLAGPAAPPREPAAARPSPSRAQPSAPRQVQEAPVGPLSTTGPVGARGDVGAPPVRTGRRASDRVRPDPADGGPPAVRAPATSAIPAAGAATTSHRVGAHPVTGPIPVQRVAAEGAADEEPLTGRESALAWVRFIGELVVALAVGIGLYFAFTVLWELMPYVALVAAPVTVTGLVAGVAAWRQRSGQGVLGVRLLAVLLLAGTVLVIAPAAGLLAG